MNEMNKIAFVSGVRKVIKRHKSHHGKGVLGDAMIDIASSIRRTLHPHRYHYPADYPPTIPNLIKGQIGYLLKKNKAIKSFHDSLVKNLNTLRNK
jgi:hypothetical protein